MNNLKEKLKEELADDRFLGDHRPSIDRRNNGNSRFRMADH